MTTIDKNVENCPPKADAMIQSMRAVGYDVSMAIADLIDNSITAEAKNIWITQNWDHLNSYIKIVDDGIGMDERKLFNAMRLGSTNPLQERAPNDLGRFGMGLKTASFSQCKLLTVRTKSTDKVINTKCWDLDYVNEKEEWLLRTKAYQHSESLLNDLENVKSGTIVLWEKLDRLISHNEDDDENLNHFLRKMDEMQEILGMIFHRYIERPGGIKIFINSGQGGFVKIKHWDPYLKTHTATRELSNEAVHIFGNSVNVRPFILPHISKLNSTEHKEAAGPKGWNAQQGIYLYRKERLIVAGGWLDLGYKAEDHYKLARIQLDIPNSMDKEWQIDVKKATAKLPDAFRKNLLRLSKLTREKASEVYRFRGKSVARKYDKVNRFVWKKTEHDGKIRYQIDQKHPIINDLLDELGDKRNIGIKLIKLIENTVPVETIIINNAENPDSFTIPEYNPNSQNFPLQIWFMDLVEIEKHNGLTEKEAIEKVLSIEPFINYPELISIYDEPEE